MYVLFHVVPVDVIETKQTTISTSCHWIWQCYLSLFYQYLFVTVSLNVNVTISCNTSKSDCVNAWCHLVWWYLYQWEVLFILYNWGWCHFVLSKKCFTANGWVAIDWCSCVVVSVSIDKCHRIWLFLCPLTSDTVWLFLCPYTGDTESGCVWVHWQVTQSGCFWVYWQVM